MEHLTTTGVPGSQAITVANDTKTNRLHRTVCKLICKHYSTNRKVDNLVETNAGAVTVIFKGMEISPTDKSATAKLVNKMYNLFCIPLFCFTALMTTFRVSKITCLTSNDPNSGYEIHLSI